MQYEARTTKITVAPVGCDIFDERATGISIDSEGGGEYVRVSQCINQEQSVTFEPEEWPSIADAIDSMIEILKKVK